LYPIQAINIGLLLALRTRAGEKLRTLYLHVGWRSNQMHVPGSLVININSLSSFKTSEKREMVNEK
jgi:hypothetical protein